MEGTPAPVETQNSLYEALLPDRRRVFLACLAVFVVLGTGQTTLMGPSASLLLATSFGLKRMDMPCQIYVRILEAIDAQVLNDLLAAFFTRCSRALRLQTQQGHREHAHVA